jgi:hypothetical protein
LALLALTEQRQRLLYRRTPGDEDTPGHRPSGRRQSERHGSSVARSLAPDDMTIGDELVDQPDGGGVAEPKRLAKLLDGAAAEEFLQRHQCRRCPAPATGCPLRLLA